MMLPVTWKETNGKFLNANNQPSFSYCPELVGFLLNTLILANQGQPVLPNFLNEKFLHFAEKVT
jgi:hypothetical protein